MQGKHFHEEWSFKMVFTRNGIVVDWTRFCATDNQIYETEEQARKQMKGMCDFYNARLREGHATIRGRLFDAFEIYAPVRRIVTEWEYLDNVR